MKVVLDPSRVAEFLSIMEADVAESRKEAGCCRFDLIAADEPNTYVMYEAYDSKDSQAFHKKTAHYKAWADFKTSTTPSPVLSQTVILGAPAPTKVAAFQ